MRRTDFEGGLGVLLEATGTQALRPPRGFVGGEMGPCLKVTMVARRCRIPRVQRTEPMELEALELIERTSSCRWRGKLGEADQEASVSEPTDQGLSPARNFPKGRIYGMKGLTGKGKRRIEEGCRILEMDRHLCTFWTTTMAEEVQKAIEAGYGSTSELTDRLMQELGRLLHAKRLPEEVVGVIEVQEERWRQSGVWAPHWHLVFQTRRHRRGRRIVSISDLDRLWRRVVLTVTGVDLWKLPEEKRRAACKTEPIKKTVGGYMRKYMRKGASPEVLREAREVAPQLVPGQWWCMSRPLLSVIQRLTGRLSASLLLYINEMEKELINDGLLFSRWRGKDNGVPPMVTYYFPSLDALAAIAARWEAGHTRSRLPERLSSAFLWI